MAARHGRRDRSRARARHHRLAHVYAQPLRPVFEQGLALRRALEPPADLTEFPILTDLKAEDPADYIIHPIEFSSGQRNAVTCATDWPGGFTEDGISLLADILPILSTILEAQSTRRNAGALLDTYLGRDPGGRVLDGTIVRGAG